MNAKCSNSAASIARCLTILLFLVSALGNMAQAQTQGGNGPVITICDDYITMPPSESEENTNAIIQVSPNPFLDNFKVTTTQNNEIQFIEVLDAEGTTIFVETLSSTCVIVNGEEWLTGEYIVNVHTTYGNFSERVVKTAY